ncbi:ribosomal protein S18-alanine N-acetyltransferase [bacterium]|nr:ribosomal protein S18-alanine N-acetyltransferase [bacterium]
MIGFTIRDMNEADLPYVIEIEQSSFDFPWSRNMFIDQLMLRDIALKLVAVHEGTVMGYVIVWLEGKDSHILNIAVGEEWRGKKIAKGILDAVIARSLNSGCNRIYLEVRKSNSYALDFYKRNGFSVIGEEEGYYEETGENALILELVIV